MGLLGDGPVSAPLEGCKEHGPRILPFSTLPQSYQKRSWKHQRTHNGKPINGNEVVEMPTLSAVFQLSLTAEVVELFAGSFLTGVWGMWQVSMALTSPYPEDMANIFRPSESPTFWLCLNFLVSFHICSSYSQPQPTGRQKQSLLGKIISMCSFTQCQLPSLSQSTYFSRNTLNIFLPNQFVVLPFHWCCFHHPPLWQAKDMLSDFIY